MALSATLLSCSILQGREDISIFIASDRDTSWAKEEKSKQA